MTAVDTRFSNRREITFATVAEMKAARFLKVGSIVTTFEYNVGFQGGNQYEIVAAGTGTDDGGSFIDLTGSPFQAKGLFEGKSILITQFGAISDGNGGGTGTDNKVPIDNALAYISAGLQINTPGTKISNGVGGELVIPLAATTGVFDTSGGHQVASGVSVIGRGEASHIQMLKSSNETFMFNVQFIELSGGSGQQFNIHTQFRNFTMQGDRGGGSVGIIHDFQDGLDYSYQFKMDNVHIFTWDVGVRLLGAYGFDLTNNSWANNGLGIFIKSGPANTGPGRITGGQMIFNGTAVVSYFPTKITYSDIHVESNEIFGFCFNGDRGTTTRDVYHESSGDGLAAGAELYYGASTYADVTFQTGSNSSTILQDSGANFGSGGLGMVAGRNTIKSLITGTVYNIVSVDSNTQLTLSVNTLGISDVITKGDSYLIEDQQGTITTTSTTQLIDTAANWVSGIGGFNTDSLAFNITTGDVFTIDAIVSTTILDITPIFSPRNIGGAEMTMSINDVYEVGFPCRSCVSSGDLYSRIFNYDNVQINGGRDIQINGMKGVNTAGPLGLIARKGFDIDLQNLMNTDVTDVNGIVTARTVTLTEGCHSFGDFRVKGQPFQLQRNIQDAEGDQWKTIFTSVDINKLTGILEIDASINVDTNRHGYIKVAIDGGSPQTITTLEIRDVNLTLDVRLDSGKLQFKPTVGFAGAIMVSVRMMGGHDL